MSKRPSRIRSFNDVFALYLARELNDTERLGWYIELAHKHPLCLLLNALRAARRGAGGNVPTPDEFAQVMRALDSEEGPL